MKIVTRYPLRPYVIHFLRLNLPLLQAELLRNSRQAKTSLAQYVRQNEGFIFDSSASHSDSNAHGEAFDIFQPEDNIITRKDFIAKHASALSSTEITKAREDDRRRSQQGPPAKRINTGSPPQARTSSSSNMTNPILSGHSHSGPPPPQPPPASVQMPPPIGLSNQTNRCPMESQYGIPIPFHHISPRRNVFEDLSCPTPSTAFLQYSANRDAGLITNGAPRPVVTAPATSCSTEQFNDRINLADLYEKDQMNYRLVYPLLSGYNSVFNEEFLREMDEEWKSAYTVSDLMIIFLTYS